jgi:hypothetical protein
VSLGEEPVHEIAVGDEDDADERLPQAHRGVLVPVVVAVIMATGAAVSVLMLVLVAAEKGGDLHD